MSNYLLDADKLRGLISTLQLAQKLGYSSTSSPVEYLFDASIDILILLSMELKEGKMPIRKTPELKFSERYQDVLGNPKQIRIERKDPLWFDPEVAKYLRKLASLMVVLKRRQSLPTALKSAGLAVGSLLTFSPVKRQKMTINLKEKRTLVVAKQHKQRAYYRRQKEKKRP